MNLKLLTTSFFFILSISLLSAQAIKIHRFQGGYRYTQGKEVLKLKHLAAVVAADKEANNLAIQAKSLSDLSFIISAIGGGFIGAPLGKAMAGGDPKWVSAGIGGGLVLSALQLYSVSANKAKAAIDIYNKSLSNNTSNKPTFNMVVKNNGVGLKMTF